MAASPGGAANGRRQTRRWTAVLLAGTCLAPLLTGTPLPAWADGGAGGAAFGIPGGAGGTGFVGNNGGNGGASSRGGGGGGAGGGAGGVGGGGSAGGGGGMGGTSGSPNGGNGGDGVGGPTSSGGGGGGGGGYNGNGAGATSIDNAGTLTGGAGGKGGDGDTDSTAAGGGGGGAGGYGAIVTGNGASSNTGTIAGGNGGDGGAGDRSAAFGGNGGDGGVGVQFTNGGTFVNSGAVTGGNGGSGGAGLNSATPGTSGAGGAGIVGSSLTVINSGTISGGFDGSFTPANAITFTGGTNVLELRAGSNITSAVEVQGGATGTLVLGGSADSSFDVGAIGGQYVNFGAFRKTGSGIWTLTDFGGSGPSAPTPWTISGGTLAITQGTVLGSPGDRLTFDGGTLRADAVSIGLSRPITITANGGTIDTNGNNVGISMTIDGPGGLTKNGIGALRLAAPMTYTGGTTLNAGTLELLSPGSLAATGALTINGGTFDMTLAGADQTVGALSGAGGIIALGANTLTTDSPANTTLASQITGSGGLVKQGSGTLALTGNSTYSGGTTVTGGLINFAAAGNFGSGPITLNGGGLQWASGTSTDISARLAPLGAGGGIFDTNGNSVTLATGLSGTGGLTKQGAGLLSLEGTSTYTGPTIVNGGTLAVNGSLASGVTIGAGGTIGGNGTLGGLVSNGGTLAPGNSIGTLTVNGNFSQNGGTYQVEADAAGQADRINVTGTATIGGGATVQVLAQPGNYGQSTTYTILNAAGGVSGTYSGVSSNLAFLTPSLSYDASNAFLTLSILQNAFSIGGVTQNQKAVGAAIDASYAGATGDYATVLGALTGLSVFQAPAALDAISGQQYADFGTMNVNNSILFMNAVGQQMAIARGGVSSGQRQALAQACDVAVCESTSPWSAWASALGGLGAVQGDGNASTASYNFGGGAAGIDYRIDPRFLVGLGAGYTAGNLWVSNFPGKGTSDSVAVAAYGSFTPMGPGAGFYADALAGYAYFYNQLQRQILIPGLQPRTANGATGANQFLGQVEAGYRLAVFAPAQATVTPFARFQAASGTQNAFTEWGADSLDLNVAQQTTTSLRTTFGAELAGAIPLGNRRRLDLDLRLGWQHEYASTSRPITAALAGAPSAARAVYGASPQRDAAVVGFSTRTQVADNAQLYLRYDGQLASGTDNHALNLGVRVTW